MSAIRPAEKVAAPWHRRRGALTGALCLLAVAGAAQAQATAPAAPPPKASADAKASPAGALFPGSNSKEPISIEADRLEYFNKEGKAIYSGNVVAVQGETTLKCTKLIITLEKQEKQSTNGQKGSPAKADPSSQSPANSGVRHMDIEGPVSLYSKDQVGTGDRGEYDKPQNKAYLYGHVVMTQGSNITRGDKLTYDLTNGVAIVEKDNASPTGRVQGYFVPGSGNTPDTKSADAKSPDTKTSKDKPPPKASAKKGAAKKKPGESG